MSTSPPQKLGLSIDPAALQALRSQGGNAPEAALRGAAKQFEALFLNMMLKSMREAAPQDGALDSEQTRMFTGMLDQQYAAQLSQGHGLGFAD
ncbi:MAG: rod-binding protein, partial [Pseudomonadota bacterium]|nr:rod-binding protein [Pseudomonadota bacterium]